MTLTQSGIVAGVYWAQFGRMFAYMRLGIHDPEIRLAMRRITKTVFEKVFPVRKGSVTWTFMGQ